MEAGRRFLKKSLYSLIVSVLCYNFVSGYNIETKKIGLVTGEQGSQFGYSVAFANKPGWTSVMKGGKVEKV